MLGDLVDDPAQDTPETPPTPRRREADELEGIRPTDRDLGLPPRRGGGAT
jgi:hypothetical protein